MEEIGNNTTLAAVVGALRASFDVRKVVLFGSHVHGNATSASDYDLLVVVNSNLPYPRRQGVAHNSVYGVCPFPLDLIVLTPDELERSASIAYSVVRTALTEGTVLYAA